MPNNLGTTEDKSCYFNNKLQISRACAQMIREKSNDLQLFILQPSTKSRPRQEAMEKLRSIQLAASRVIATSDRALTGAVPNDVDLLISQLEVIVEHNGDNLTYAEKKRMMLVMSEAWATLYTNRPECDKGLGVQPVTLDRPQEAA